MRIPATGTGFTVMTTVPDFPCAVAVIVAVPGAIAATLPDCVTVATSGAELAYETVAVVTGFPLESESVTESCVDSPTVRSCENAATVTVATGGGPDGSPPPQAARSAGARTTASGRRTNRFIEPPRMMHGRGSLAAPTG